MSLMSYDSTNPTFLSLDLDLRITPAVAEAFVSACIGFQAHPRVKTPEIAFDKTTTILQSRLTSEVPATR